MKRVHYESSALRARFQANRWQLFAFLLSLANVLLAVRIAGSDNHEKTVLVPPSLERPVWVRSDKVSAAYLQEMSRYFSTLILNVTPKSVDSGIDVFLRYVSPAAFGKLRNSMELQAQRLKRNSVSTAFYPVDYQIKEKAREVVVMGDFITIVGTQKVPAQRRAWRLTYALSDGRLWITEFVEVDHDHPFSAPLDSLGADSEDQRGERDAAD